MQQVQGRIEYPRVYRPATTWAVFFGLAGAGIALAGALGTWYFGTGHEVHGRYDTLMLVTVSMAFVCLGLLLLSYLMRSEMVLHADRIEVHGPLGTKQMSYDQIEGRRLVTSNNPPSTLVLVERHTGRKLQITQIFREDEFFFHWFRSLPDLDERDRVESERQILGEIDHATGQDRAGELVGARRIALGLIVATIAASAWALLYPRPYSLALGSLVALPWIALFIAWRSKGLFRVDQRKNDAHPSIGIPFLMPGFILMLVVMRDVHVLSVNEALMATLVVASLLCLVAATVDPNLRSRFGMMVLFAGLSAAYGFGASMVLDVTFDHSPAQVYSTKVISQHITHGKSTSYYLLLEPWGPNKEPDRVSVPRSLYGSVAPGQAVCVEARQGALKIGWYTVGVCQ